MQAPSIRKIKLHRKLRIIDRGWTRLASDVKEVPWLNVSGLWLAKAGFPAGTPVEIHVKHNQLIIKKAIPDYGTHRA